jgi:hypothetical protein
MVTWILVYFPELQFNGVLYFKSGMNCKMKMIWNYLHWIPKRGVSLVYVLVLHALLLRDVLLEVND